VTALTSKWALPDHLEYCSEDKLSDVDEYDDNLETVSVPSLKSVSVET